MASELPPAVALLRQQAEAFGGRATIVGKGPSFNEFDGRASQGRFVVGLNETSLHASCNAAFIIDEDILERQADALAQRSLSAVIVPYAPHRPRNVGGLALYLPGQRGSSDGEAPRWTASLAGRVSRFNLGTAPPRAELGETVPPYNFSAPTLAHLLALAGFDDIQLVGIDGGTRYSKDFAAYEYKKLKSIQDSFDIQFDDLRRVRDRFGVRFSSIRCERPFVLIGSEPEQCLATEVLKWSIESRTFLKVEFVDPGHQARDLYAHGRAGTPFSFQRLYLPALADRVGRGIYFDSDMLVMRDVYELFNWDMGTNVLLGCAPTSGRDVQYSVFLVDNRRATWDADALLSEYRQGRLSYPQIIGRFEFAEPRASTLPAQWNSLEVYEPGQTGNIHFTDMGRQPWLSINNPNAALWCEALAKAARDRAGVQEALQLSNARGWVRPSLLWQVEHDHHNPWTLPRHVKRLDDRWLPPHAVLRGGRTPRALQVLKWRLVSQIHRFMRTPLYGRLKLARNGLRKVL